MLAQQLRIIILLFVALALMLPASCAVGSNEDDNGSSRAANNNNFAGANFADVSRTISFCGTEAPDNDTMTNLAMAFGQFLTDASLNRSAESALLREEVYIPVHFHVISKGPTFDEGEVPDDMIIEQVAVMNRAFSGETGGVATPFRFDLAGINRVRNAEWHKMSLGSATEMEAKSQLKVGGADTLNIYLVDIQTTAEDVGEDGEGVVLGYTILPVFYFILGPYDGVVLNFKTLPGGPITRYGIGHVAVHETGHWLGLMHTFMGGCDGFFDDLISDTPRELSPEAGQYCPVGRDSCPSAQGEDPIHNHMTYTVDECRFEFTQGQVDFMDFNVQLFRGMSAY